MQQILEQIRDLKTPLKLNAFINGKTVAIARDNSLKNHRIECESNQIIRVFAVRNADKLCNAPYNKANF